MVMVVVVLLLLLLSLLLLVPPKLLVHVTAEMLPLPLLATPKNQYPHPPKLWQERRQHILWRHHLKELTQPQPCYLFSIHWWLLDYQSHNCADQASP